MLTSWLGWCRSWGEADRPLVPQSESVFTSWQGPGEVLEEPGRLPSCTFLLGSVSSKNSNTNTLPASFHINTQSLYDVLHPKLSPLSSPTRPLPLPFLSKPGYFCSSPPLFCHLYWLGGGRGGNKGKLFRVKHRHGFKFKKDQTEHSLLSWIYTCASRRAYIRNLQRSRVCWHKLGPNWREFDWKTFANCAFV